MLQTTTWLSLKNFLKGDSKSAPTGLRTRNLPWFSRTKLTFHAKKNGTARGKKDTP